MTEIRVHKNIFQEFPTFRRGIVVAKEIQNHDHSKELEVKLNQAIEQSATQPIDLKADDRIIVWYQAHRQFNSSPNKFPPAHSALLKRVQKSGAHIPFINNVVAIMNYNSIIDVMPVGGDDVIKAGGNLELCYAHGGEIFRPLGNPESVGNPYPGEIIYVVSELGEVMCRRWNWRNGHKTRITEDTHTIVMNIDGLGENSEARTVITRDRVAGMLEEFCHAHTITAMLSPSQRVYQFDI